MATSSSTTRGTWNSKLGFILAAAGSAVGLGNIWAFPTKVATEGGAAYLLIYLLCTFAIGFPVMAAEITIGRRAGKNPVGAFKAISSNKFFPLVGIWGVICGVMILSFYTVIAGWAFGFAFEEIFYFFGWADAANWLTNTGNGFKNALIASVFMFATIRIITGGVSDGIERATKAMMPLLIGIIIVMIVYVLWQPGSNAGIEAYLLPDFSRINAGLIFSAMGQAFFSLSLGMGALITYGSYLSKRENIPQAAAFVTLADVGIAFLAGLLIVPAMFLAQSQGISIDAGGSLASSTDLVFQILPALFHTIGGGVGMILGVTFFLLLSIAALTSTISLLEVPVSYVIDEFEVKRKKAAWSVGLGILVISVIVAYFPVLIGWFDYLFSSIGLPLGGFLICIFVGYFWTTDKAITEMESGYAGVRKSLFAKVWPIFIKYICPAAILYNLISNFV
ncbi:sodium-dependent transporter [Rhodohalobacter sulfatireducens]|uniref:Sodium-dependent transporter n=1 Tax=Rhodohalobacter sulfatireducens TaxID=2911366 RepID=A0ABS9KGW4_9BACT|nr:sodium-dependent transporter [Rhodohalobacter sulfatireducens]MCG2590083.1 sodium-dependent transporter [Rhodohalobacter sulfatireducens]MDR9366041.1 sodium-dependent transporter [Balneolaceae bacterium]MDR9410218.1 sodium-dependent transporter [Balneolaceae bacterium]